MHYLDNKAYDIDARRNHECNKSEFSFTTAQILYPKYQQV